MGQSHSHGLENKDTTIYIALIGPSGVGKSSLTQAFLCGRYIENYDDTISDRFRKSVEIDNVQHLIEIFADRALPENASQFNSLYLQRAHAIIICYSLSDGNAQEELNYSAELFKEIECNKPVIVAATKSDAANPLTRDPGIAFAQQHGFLHMVTSAKDRINVEQVFNAVVRQVCQRHQGSSTKNARTADSK